LRDNIIEIESQFESLFTKQVLPTIQIGTIQPGTSYGSSGGPLIKRDESPKKVTINEPSPRKLTINTKDEHTRVIKIRAEEEDDSPFLPREDEYKQTAESFMNSKKMTVTKFLQEIILPTINCNPRRRSRS